eukprot:456822-Rhodomonas_salina.1
MSAESRRCVGVALFSNSSHRVPQEKTKSPIRRHCGSRGRQGVEGEGVSEVVSSECGFERM